MEFCVSLFQGKSQTFCNCQSFSYVTLLDIIQLQIMLLLEVSITVYL